MNILPDSPYPAQQPERSLDDRLWREIQMMSASGWTLLHRWHSGAIFHSVTKGGFPMWAHMILLVITLGVWLPFFVLIEIFSKSGTQRWCELRFDDHGQPKYQTIDRPKWL